MIVSSLVGRDVYSVAKFRRGFNENNLANFAKLSCTIKLRLCANAILGRLYYLCSTQWLWRLEKFSSILQMSRGGYSHEFWIGVCCEGS